MKNITLSADEELIESARQEARDRRTTLNAMFREWLEAFAKRDQRRKEVEKLFNRMDDFDSGGPFTREALNER